MKKNDEDAVAAYKQEILNVKKALYEAKSLPGDKRACTLCTIDTHGEICGAIKNRNG